jgi:lysophospholipase L1-like esterase
VAPVGESLKRRAWRALLVFVVLVLWLESPTSYEAFIQARRRAVLARYFEGARWHQLRFEQAAQCQPGTRAVLIGDSLTAGVRPHWPGPAGVVNMGIPGDFSSGVFMRLATVVACRPRQVFVMIGINDILEQMPIAELQANHLRIVRTLREHAPGTEIFVQGVLPTVDRLGRLTASAEFNQQVRLLNRFLAEQAAAEGFVFIDLVHLADGSDRLRPELTPDGVHLNGSGYALWYRSLKPYLDAPPSLAGG